MAMKEHLKKLTLAAMFLALGILLPFLTGQIPQIGKMLLPMHIPVLLCGLICGPVYGGVVGFVTPLLRFLWFAAPPMPGAASMAFELAAYGLFIGLLYGLSRKKTIFTIYGSLILSMIGGRLVWGAAQAIILGANGSAFTFKMFLAGALLDAIPGIIIQLLLIPAVMFALDKAKLIRLSGDSSSAANNNGK